MHRKAFQQVSPVGSAWIEHVPHNTCQIYLQFHILRQPCAVSPQAKNFISGDFRKELLCHVSNLHNVYTVTIQTNL